MKLYLDTDLKEFSQNAKSFFENEKRLHSMILGLVRRHFEIQKPMSILARLVDDHGKVVAAGIQTEDSRTLILGNIPVEIAEVFAEEISRKVSSLPGVNGPVPTVDAFAQKWARLKKKNVKICMNLRLFEFKELTYQKTPSGRARLAERRDRDLIFDWFEEFRKEAAPHDPPQPDREQFLQAIDRAIDLGRYFVWEDQGNIVSFVGSARETDDEKWIAPVYTPPAFRGKGYGSALTAFVSQKILDLGKVGMLFTDLANPISNGIYQKMGYRPLADFKHLAFDEEI